MSRFQDNDMYLEAYLTITIVNMLSPTSADRYPVLTRHLKAYSTSLVGQCRTFEPFEPLASVILFVSGGGDDLYVVVKLP